jgi:hypothetical protein
LFLLVAPNHQPASGLPQAVACLLRHALEISKEYFASKGKTITRMELLEAAKQANDAVKQKKIGR